MIVRVAFVRWGETEGLAVYGEDGRLLLAATFRAGTAAVNLGGRCYVVPFRRFREWFRGLRPKIRNVVACEAWGTLYSPREGYWGGRADGCLAVEAEVGQLDPTPLAEGPELSCRGLLGPLQ